MSKKLYVGNLPYSVNDDQLKEMFVPFGEVTSAKIIQDKISGQSKGFGFVEMANDEEAAKAIQELDGKESGGRNLKVNEARPMAPRSGGGGGGFRRGGGGGGGGGRDRRDYRGGGGGEGRGGNRW